MASRALITGYSHWEAANLTDVRLIINASFVTEGSMDSVSGQTNAEFPFSATGATIESAIIDAVVQLGLDFGLTIARTSVFLPTYKKGS